MKTSMMKQQNGTTLTGFIFGLVLGLAIALVVAMVITKTPTPFMNKVGKVEKPEGETIQDPNRTLYGGKDAPGSVVAVKEPAKEPPKEPAKEATHKEPAQEVKVTSTNPVVQPGGAHEPPTVDKKPTKTAESEGDEKSTYYLQVGAYKDFNAAEASRAKLTLLGIEAKIVEKPSDVGSLFQVRVGPYHQVDTMSKMRARLNENGVDVAIVKIMK